MGTSDLYRLLGGLFFTIGLFTFTWFLFILGAFFLALPYFHQWWSKRVDSWIQVTCTSNQSRVMPGSAVSLQLSIINRSYLPLPKSMLTFQLPLSVQVEGADFITEINNINSISLSLDIPARSQISRSVQIVPNARGVLWLRELKLTMITPFATDNITLDRPIRYSLLVYPTLLPLSAYKGGALEPVGNRLSVQRMQDDPVFIRGARNYMAGDRVKHIDWKATAKTSSLQTRLFEFTAQEKWVVLGHILPAYDSKHHRFNDNLNEQTISMIATTITRFRHLNIPYTLHLSVKQRGKEYLQIPEGSGKNHYVHVMTHLAKLHQFVPTSLIPLLRRLERSTNRLSVLVISHQFTDETKRMLTRLYVNGHQLVLLDLSGDQPVYRAFDSKELATIHSSSTTTSSKAGRELDFVYEG
ncbi:DUF58 domain-containing protein [Brevibacillus daliensis]|uniref:DUF58 domain-containing protein n=1 Tax=Brevibacillus daliensis TaxID=2892995 RepID=UPI001E2FD0B9|nr:DUF58 domain-containing protein [Brevibacillus daliensis]